MSERVRKAFLLRMDARVHRALERWAAAELRSVNAHIEYLLRRALEASGRLRRADAEQGEQGFADVEAGDLVRGRCRAAPLARGVCATAPGGRARRCLSPGALGWVVEVTVLLGAGGWWLLGLGAGSEVLLFVERTEAGIDTASARRRGARGLRRACRCLAPLDAPHDAGASAPSLTARRARLCDGVVRDGLLRAAVDVGWAHSTWGGVSPQSEPSSLSNLYLLQAC